VTVVLALAGLAGPLRAADAGPRRVLVVTSFGTRFAPFEAFAAALRTGIVDGWPGPVEFFETPLEIARFEAPAEEEPFAGYLRSLVANRKLDLVVTIGFPAASFVTRWQPFPEAPTLIAGLERRQAADLTIAGNELLVTAVYDPPAVVENALRLLPDTKRMAVVLGASPVERYWRGELERDLASFAGRLAFDWWDGLTLDGMLQKAGAMEPGSAILYATLRVDAAGIVHERDQGLEALRAVSGYAAFEHWWTTVLRSTLAAGFVGVDNLDAQPHDALHKTKQLSLNLAWSPIRRLDLMSEVLWGRRRNKDGSRGDATQLQLGSTFRF